MARPTERDKQIMADKIRIVATPEQREVLVGMQSGTEFLFFFNLFNNLGGSVSMQKQEGITAERIDKVLELMFNECEGDFSQVDAEHLAYARSKGWTKGWED